MIHEVLTMRISTKGIYGVKAMLDLSVNSLGDQVSLKSIAERQNISDKYLEQVFSTLRKAGLVTSIKGPQGGYMLAKDAKDITIGDILRALEGDLSVIDEAKDNTDSTIDTCITNNVWDKINNSINTTVNSITLKDLNEDYKKLQDNTPIMYYI